LSSPDPRARAAASRVVPHWQGRVSDGLALLAPRVEDEHPRVRLEAVRALAKFPEPRAVEIAMRGLDRSVDKWMDYALWLTARETQSRWLPALEAGTLDFGGDGKKVTFAMSAAGSPAVVGPLLSALKAGSIGNSQTDSTIKLIATLGSPKDLGMLFELAIADGTADPQRVGILDGLVAASRARKVRPDGDLTRLGALIGSKDVAVQVAAIRALGAWKLESLRDKLVVDQGHAAIDATHEALAELGGDLSLKTLDGNSRMLPTEHRVGAIVALAALDPKLAAERSVTLLQIAKGSEIPRAVDVTGLISGLTGRKGASSALADAIDKITPGELPVDAAKVAIRSARASGRDESRLIAALASAAKVTSGAIALTDTEMREAVADVLAQGDPARGEAIFRRKDLQCMNCHAIAGAGGVVGPGMESIGASAQIDYLIDSLLQPGKAIKEGYHSVTVATDDGRVLTGVKLRDTDQELLLRDADGRDVAIPAKSVEEKKDAGSLMPVGLTETLTRGELLDLVRFLSELGKVGPYSVSKSRLVRRWQMQASTRPETLADWSPAYSRVDGSLPIDALVSVGESAVETARVRFEIDVTTPGPVRVRLNSIKGINELVIDGAKHEVKTANDVELKPGRHLVTMSLDLKTRANEALRVEIEDVPGSPAKALPVVGK